MPTVYSTNFPYTPEQLEILQGLRQKSIVDNTNKLLKLAKKLNAEVNGAHAGPLTEDQLSQVEEIEKLAHKVRSELNPAWEGK